MRKIALTLVCAFSITFLFAQQEVSVTVKDAKTGVPLPNASVKVKSSKKGATTNAEGLLKIMATANDVLEITNVGYKNKSITLSGQSEISI
ncbi:MAG: carboxypeptidase-like regulatory domain-containing protein, partial [Panacibacter sp.]